MITFPNELVFNDNEIKFAREWADKMRHKLNSYEGTFRGELAELSLLRYLKKSGHSVLANNENKTKQYEWDLMVDGTMVDVKTTTGKYITVGTHTLKCNIDEILFPCYRFLSNKFQLIGTIDGKQLQRLVQLSKIYYGYYISVAAVKKHSK
jgi:hypothetical protein